MSDSEGSNAPSRTPSDATIEEGLRDAVATLFESNKDDITVKKARTAAEKALKLQEGFFKSHATWNQKSKDVATEEVVCIVPSLTSFRNLATDMIGIAA